MKPLKLTMRAFGSYGEETTIDFTKLNQNIFLITGDTGAGKTTVFDAIVFALYGEASSDNNRKDGVELQSQFTDVSITPMVKLEFYEIVNGIGGVYTVTRIPRHKSARKRGTGGDITAPEAVSLTLPDGTEYIEKGGIDSKLESLVGLTKAQFMKVAMIAQGEFMDILRDKTSSKKAVFQKLFNTDIYGRIIEKSKSLKDAKDKVIANIRTECATHAARTRFRDGDTQCAGMKALIEELGRSQQLSVSTLEAFMNGLRELCSGQEEDLNKARSLEAAKLKEYNSVHDNRTEADMLIASFIELENAAKVLDECERQKPEIEAMNVLKRQLEEAYRLQEIFTRAQTAEREYRRVTDGIAEDEIKAKETASELAEAERIEGEAEAYSKTVHDNYGRLKEQADKTIELINRIDILQKKDDLLLKDKVKAQESKNAADEHIQTFENEEAGMKAEEEHLAASDMRYAVWKELSDSAAALKKEAAGQAADTLRLINEQADYRKTSRLSSDAERAYLESASAYNNMHAAYFNAQAGIMARELLHEGMPCPVCGAKEHPKPASDELSEELQHLTKEQLDELKAQSEDLRAEAEQLSNKALEEGTKLSAGMQAMSRELDKTAKALRNAQERLKENNFFEEPAETVQELVMDTVTAEALQKYAEALLGRITDICRSLMSLEPELLANKNRLEAIRSRLRLSGERRRELNDLAERAAAELNRVGDEYSGNHTMLEDCKAQLEKLCPDREAAMERLQRAEQEDKRAASEYSQRRAAREKLKTLADTIASRLEGYRREQPERQTAYSELMAEYSKKLKTSGISEEEWKSLVGKYERQELDRLGNEIIEYGNRIAVAEELHKSSLERIGGRNKPDISLLIEKEAQLKEEYDSLSTAANVICNILETNRDVLACLEKNSKERMKAVAEYDRLNTLYRILSGTQKGGSKMDIETYVQRYYLERILDAANVRFLNMSRGQFELRIMNEDEASSGSNRGLDLMVYSNANGRMRDVRTLSGGESFMAALALELGTADIIKADSASINLDIMFIDEGFGSLDDTARNEAIKVLKQMSGTSRLIGIISHVSELKQEIDNQLIITKDAEGSHAEWQIS